MSEVVGVHKVIELTFPEGAVCVIAVFYLHGEVCGFFVDPEAYRWHRRYRYINPPVLFIEMPHLLEQVKRTCTDEGIFLLLPKATSSAAGSEAKNRPQDTRRYS